MATEDSNEETEVDANDDRGWLEVMMDSADNGDTTIPLTLFVPGGIVSGMLIGTLEFVNARNLLIYELNTYPGKKDYREYTKADLMPFKKKWICLKDARIFRPNGILNLGLWTGSLESIAGYSLGLFGYPDELETEG